MYDYIEVMACPMGCVNGGGQLKSKLLKPRPLATCLHEYLLTQNSVVKVNDNILADSLSKAPFDFTITYKHIQPDETQVRW